MGGLPVVGLSSSATNTSAGDDVVASGRYESIPTNIKDPDDNSHTSLGDAPEIILPPYTTGIWNTDEDLIAMRTHMRDEILETWDNGMNAFIKGDWENAREEFNRVLEITSGKDGPSQNILRHMDEDYGGNVPMDWKGYRDMS